MRRFFIDWCVDLSPGELSGNGFPVVGDLRERDVLVVHLMQHQTCVQTGCQQLGRQQRITWDLGCGQQMLDVGEHGLVGAGVEDCSCGGEDVALRRDEIEFGATERDQALDRVSSRPQRRRPGDDGGLQLLFGVSSASISPARLPKRRETVALPTPARWATPRMVSAAGPDSANNSVAAASRARRLRAASLRSSHGGSDVATLTT
jgi:hypothetical protein